MTHRPFCTLRQNSLEGARHHQTSTFRFFVVFIYRYYFLPSFLFASFIWGVRKFAKSDYISFVLSVCLSVCPHGTTRLQLDLFS